MKPGSEGTPSERTGGTLPPNEHKPLYPGWVSRLHAEGLDRPLVARR